jgi:hypothetical protein
MEEDRVLFNFVTGRPEEIVTTVLRKISALTRASLVRWFKVGITSDPQGRFRKHKRHYDRMIVVYSSSSINYVRDLECELIEHNSDLADNFIEGGGGRSGQPPYFMYVVVKDW